MTDAISIFKHKFEITEIAVTGIPVASPVFNELDSFGTLLGLPRLPVERNASYKKRLLDVYARRASSTYTGLLNGITRELGLEFSNPITISKRTSVSSSIQPAIEFIENYVVVYSDKSTDTVEFRLDRSNPANPGYWLTDFVDYINNNSSYIEATLDSDIEPYTRTDTIVNQSSYKLALGISLRSSNLQILPNKNIEKQSMVFDDKQVFAREVATEGLVLKAGDYTVDYINGTVKSFTVPSLGSRVRYKYHILPFEPVASPIIIRNLQSDLFKEFMFTTHTALGDGEDSLGLPTTDGATIINELMSVFPMYWGN